jgi:phosphopantothenoylcysteine decarboxylase/phosphopantothenate--cysteine ligase
MNTLMYEHAATQENLRVLKARGAVEVEPGCGPLACGDEGRGRMAPVEDILDEVEKALTPPDLAGWRILVTAGPTREPIDPVRFLSNRSSGKMGHALARAARLRGAEVTLVSGPSALASPRGVRLLRVETASEMMRSVEAESTNATAVIMAAAVADFSPGEVSAGKLEKSALSTLSLTPNPDILAALGSRSPRPFLIGFAAETGPGGIDRARAKLIRKGADIIVFNDVSDPGSGFDTDTNRIVILDREGAVEERPLASKDDAAHAILDRLPRA